MMTIKKKRIIITMIAIIIIVTVGTIALIILSENTNLFRSKEEIVKEYVGQVFDRITNIINFDYEKQIYASLDNSVYESNTEVILNNKNKDSKLKFISDSQVDNVDNYKYNYTKLSYGEENIAEIEYLKQDEIMGIRLTNLIKQFVSIKNENLDEVVKKLDNVDTEKYNVPEKIEEMNLSQEIKINNEEIQILKEKYINFICKYVAEKEMTTQKDAMVTIGEQTVTANAYSIEINKAELNNIYIEILENLKSEEIVLSKISNIENLYSDFILNQEDVVKNYYISQIDSLINYIKSDKIDYKIKITFYEKENKVMKINIEQEMRKININLINDNEILINDLVMGDEEEAKTKETKITKNNGELKIEVTTTQGKEKTNFNIKETVVKEAENIKTEVSIIYNDEEEKALYFNNNIKILKKIEKKFNIEENNIIINELSEQKLNTIINTIVDIIKKELPNRIKILQKGIDMSIANNIVVSENGMTEGEKNLFNSKFEFYAGENITKENVETLLEVVKQNLEKIEIVADNVTEEVESEGSNEEEKKNKEIRLKIKENSKYEGNLQEINKILEKAKTFKVKIEYNKDTEIIEYINIKPNENNE